MKKVLSFIVIATMLMAMMLTSAFAAPDGLGIGLVKVLYAGADTITVDGTINASEWDETNSLKLKCGTTMESWTTDYPGEIQFFYSWGDDGLYMAAKVIDSTLTLTAVDAEGGNTPQDRFQIAFNPCGLMYDDASGLFFSFYPTYADGTDPATVTSGTVGARKHNWEENTDDQQDVIEAGYKGAYTVTEDGWDMEVVLPWSLIATKDRVWDIIDYDTEGAFCSVLDPKNEDRTKAFTEAIIAYVDYKELEDAAPNTGRTVAEAGKANEWSVGTYDITLKFYMEGESTDDETVTYYTVEDLKAIFTDVDWSAFETGDEEETEAPDEGDETNAPSAADTSANGKDTAAAGTNAADTTGTGSTEEGSNLGLIIGIVAAVVVVIAVVVIVIAKKKK
mgnify:CR=1 FL=1